MSELTFADIHSMFEYDLETGHLLKNGRRVGTPHSLGYLKVKIRRRTYFVHRLVFLYCHGRWPVQVDHINRNKSDNRIENLRECDYSQSSGNRGKCVNNTSGFKGVHYQRSVGLWRAQVAYRVIGHFKSALEAARAYDKGAIEHFGEEFAVTNRSLGLMS